MKKESELDPETKILRFEKRVVYIYIPAIAFIMSALGAISGFNYAAGQGDAEIQNIKAAVSSNTAVSTESVAELNRRGSVIQANKDALEGIRTDLKSHIENENEVNLKIFNELGEVKGMIRALEVNSNE